MWKIEDEIVYEANLREGKVEKRDIVALTPTSSIKEIDKRIREEAKEE